MRTVENQILDITSLATTSSAAIDIFNHWNFAVQFVWTGTPTGIASLNASCDGINWTALGASYSQAISGSAGNVLFNYENTGFRFFQAVYTHTSGAGTVSCVFNAKGV